MQGSRTKNATKSAIAGLINRVIGLVIPFVLRTALIKVLGEEYLGLSSLFSSILQVLNIADLGFSTAIVYNMYKPIAEGDDDTVCALLKLYRTIYVTIGLIILVAGLCVMPFLDRLISGDYPKGLNIYALYLMYLANTVCSYLFFADRKSLMTALQQWYIPSYISSITLFVLDIIKLILLFALENYYVYILFIPLTTMVSGLISSIVSYIKYPQYTCRGSVSKEMRHDIMVRVSGLTIQKIGNTVSTSLDSIIISSFLGLSALAIYSNYFYIVSSLIALAWICISATTAGLGNSIAIESKEKNYGNFKKLNLMNQWVIAWCIPCLICLYQHFMRIWVGESLMEGTALVICMTLYFWICETRKVVLVFKDASGMWWADKWKPLVGCLVNLTFNIVSVQYIGMVGVILSTVVSYLFIEAPWETHVLFKRYFERSEREYGISILKNLAVIIISSAASWILCSLLPETGVVFFFVKALICFCLSNISFFVVFGRSAEYKFMCDLILGVLRKTIRKVNI